MNETSLLIIIVSKTKMATFNQVYFLRISSAMLLFDVKTSDIHFYAQRNSSFNTTTYAIIPFDLAPYLNDGKAMDLTFGIFTAPVSGVYHFEFPGVKSSSATLRGHYSLNKRRLPWLCFRPNFFYWK